jgi:hypothetical protein
MKIMNRRHIVLCLLIGFVTICFGSENMSTVQYKIITKTNCMQIHNKQNNNIAMLINACFSLENVLKAKYYEVITETDCMQIYDKQSNRATLLYNKQNIETIRNYLLGKQWFIINFTNLSSKKNDIGIVIAHKNNAYIWWDEVGQQFYPKGTFLLDSNCSNIKIVNIEI